jgi:hypothetical protein
MKKQTFDELINKLETESFSLDNNEDANQLIWFFSHCKNAIKLMKAYDILQRNVKNLLFVYRFVKTQRIIDAAVDPAFYGFKNYSYPRDDSTYDENDLNDYFDESEPESFSDLYV